MRREKEKDMGSEQRQKDGMGFYVCVHEFVCVCTPLYSLCQAHHTARTFVRTTPVVRVSFSFKTKEGKAGITMEKTAFRTQKTTQL